MSRFKLQVHIIPGQLCETGDAELSKHHIRRFLHITASSNDLNAVCEQISNRFSKLYPDDDQLTIERVQDKNKCDLDPDFLVEEVFENGDVIRILIGGVLPPLTDTSMISNSQVIPTSSQVIPTSLISTSLVNSGSLINSGSTTPPNVKIPHKSPTSHASGFNHQSTPLIPPAPVLTTDNSIPESSRKRTAEYFDTVDPNIPVKSRRTIWSQDKDTTVGSIGNVTKDVDNTVQSMVLPDNSSNSIMLPPPEDDVDSSKLIPKKRQNKTSAAAGGQRITSGMLNVPVHTLLETKEAVSRVENDKLAQSSDDSEQDDLVSQSAISTMSVPVTSVPTTAVSTTSAPISANDVSEEEEIQDYNMEDVISNISNNFKDDSSDDSDDKDSDHSDSDIEGHVVDADADEERNDDNNGFDENHVSNRTLNPPMSSSQPGSSPSKGPSMKGLNLSPELEKELSKQMASHEEIIKKISPSNKQLSKRVEDPTIDKFTQREMPSRSRSLLDSLKISMAHDQIYPKNSSRHRRKSNSEGSPDNVSATIVHPAKPTKAAKKDSKNSQNGVVTVDDNISKEPANGGKRRIVPSTTTRTPRQKATNTNEPKSSTVKDTKAASSKDAKAVLNKGQSTKIPSLAKSNRDALKTVAPSLKFPNPEAPKMTAIDKNNSENSTDDSSSSDTSSSGSSSDSDSGSSASGSKSGSGPDTEEGKDSDSDSSSSESEDSNDESESDKYKSTEENKTPSDVSTNGSSNTDKSKGSTNNESITKKQTASVASKSDKVPTQTKPAEGKEVSSFLQKLRKPLLNSLNDLVRMGVPDVHDTPGQAAKKQLKKMKDDSESESESSESDEDSDSDSDSDSDGDSEDEKYIQKKKKPKKSAFQALMRDGKRMR